jgi:hypothetical protein
MFDVQSRQTDYNYLKQYIKYLKYKKKYLKLKNLI